MKKEEKNLDEIEKLSSFDVTGRKPNASGGRVPLWTGGFPDFFQMTPEKIAEAKNLSWKDAWNLEKKYKYNPKYPGGVGKGKYTWEGLKSLMGMGDPKIGGASPLTRKLALGAKNILPRLLSKAALPLELLRATPANAAEVGMTSEDFDKLREKEKILMNENRRQQRQAEGGLAGMLGE